MNPANSFVSLIIKIRHSRYIWKRQFSEYKRLTNIVHATANVERKFCASDGRVETFVFDRTELTFLNVWNKMSFF